MGEAGVMDTVVIRSSDSDDQPLIQKANPSANKRALAGAKGGVKRHPGAKGGVNKPQRRAKESSEDSESSSGSEVSSDVLY